MSVSQYPSVICGDFNAPAIDWSSVSPSVSSPVTNTMCVYFTSTSLVSYLQSKHVRPCFTNAPALIADVNVVDNLPSTDCDSIHFSLSLSLQPQKPFLQYTL